MTDATRRMIHVRLQKYDRNAGRNLKQFTTKARTYMQGLWYPVSRKEAEKLRAVTQRAGDPRSQRAFIIVPDAKAAIAYETREREAARHNSARKQGGLDLFDLKASIVGSDGRQPLSDAELFDDGHRPTRRGTRGGRGNRRRSRVAKSDPAKAPEVVAEPNPGHSGKEPAEAGETDHPVVPAPGPGPNDLGPFTEETLGDTAGFDEGIDRAFD